MKSAITQTTTANKLPHLKNYNDIEIIKTRVFSITQDTYYDIKLEVFDYPSTGGELITSMHNGYVALQEIFVCDILEGAQYTYCALIYEDKIYEDFNGWFSSMLNSTDIAKLNIWLSGFLEGVNVASLT